MLRLLARLWGWPLVIFAVLFVVGCLVDPGHGAGW